jgi:hypothetical protein
MTVTKLTVNREPFHLDFHSIKLMISGQKREKYIITNNTSSFKYKKFTVLNLL